MIYTFAYLIAFITVIYAGFCMNFSYRGIVLFGGYVMALLLLYTIDWVRNRK